MAAVVRNRKMGKFRNKKRSADVSMEELMNSEEKTSRERFRKIKRGVVYVGHLPHGFYEAQMRDYFSQFGSVLRLRMSRSRKTARSKGYAFVEFEDQEVAKIAADSMNNYLMLEKLVKCEYIPPERVHQDIFKNYGDRMIPYAAQVASRRKVNSEKSKAKLGKMEFKRSNRLTKFRQTLTKFGVDFDFKLIGLKDSILEKMNLAPKTQKPYQMEVDSSDDEITFKTPPNVVKVKLIKK